MVREKECNFCHVYCKAKRWFQKSQEFFSIQFRRRVKMERKREKCTHTRRFKVEYFSPLLKYSSLFHERLLELFSFSHKKI
jgi:hypothetical protein